MRGKRAFASVVFAGRAHQGGGSGLARSCRGARPWDLGGGKEVGRVRIEDVPTPCYVVDEKKIRCNLSILRSLEEEAGCRVLLAQKAFSMYSLYPLIGSYISGTAASGLFEARLGREEMGGEVHVFAPAYKDADMEELSKICDHVVFNSLSQYERHLEAARANGAKIGLRVNPEHSTQKGTPLYDPCAPHSRLGITRGQMREHVSRAGRFPEGVTGLHFHTLCEQDAGDLVETFAAFEEGFGRYMGNIGWLNLGGGHHITREGYHMEALVGMIRRIREKYGVDVYLEPGEAVALGAGYLVAEVCDIVHNGMDILILDASASCHMPDVLEMPYRPPLRGGYTPGEKPYLYRLASITCLAGDVIGDYSFECPVSVGDRLIFEDMAIYTMVKNNTFNGIPLPAIALMGEDGDVRIVREFGYGDFKGRLS